MNNIIYKFLCTMIPQSSISVFNSPVVTVYAFDTFDANAQEIHVDIQLFNSYNGPTGPRVQYDVFINGELIESATKTVLEKSKTLKNSMADKLEYLAQLCSKKIIAQEYESQKVHMLKQFAYTQNQWES